MLSIIKKFLLPVSMGLSQRSRTSDIEMIKQFCQEKKQFSWTSQSYQATVVESVFTCQGNVLEVGCFRGGLTAQLAYACHCMKKKCFFLDIDATAIQETLSLLKHFGLHSSCRFFLGSLQSFATQNPDLGHPSLIVVDGDHDYEATKKDIATILSMRIKPSQVIFHDYSLRSKNTEENVQKAIADMLPQMPIRLIGESFAGQGHATREAPNPDGHYWEVPGAEGALVQFLK